MQRSIRAVLITAIVASGLVALAHPAAAGQHSTTGTRSSWAYTDSVSPFKTFLNGADDLPAGA